MEETRGGRVVTMKERSRERSGSLGVLEMWKRKRNVAEGVEGSGTQNQREAEQFLSRTRPISPLKRGGRGERKEVSMMEMLKDWMEKLEGKRGRMEDSLRMIMKELEKRKKKEEWKAEKDRTEERIGELEKKWERSMKIKEEEFREKS